MILWWDSNHQIMILEDQSKSMIAELQARSLFRVKLASPGHLELRQNYRSADFTKYKGQGVSLFVSSMKIMLTLIKADLYFNEVHQLMKKTIQQIHQIHQLPVVYKLQHFLLKSFSCFVKTLAGLITIGAIVLLIPGLLSLFINHFHS